jgi:kumamolisin
MQRPPIVTLSDCREGFMESKSKLDGSYRPAPVRSIVVGEVEATEEIVVTIHLKGPSEKDQVRTEPSKPAERLTRQLVLAAEKKMEYSPAEKIFKEFASGHGLRLRMDLERCCAHLEGSAAQISELFETSLCIYHDEHGRFRAHTGFLSIPEEVAPWTLGVLGLDQRPVVQRRPTSLASDGSGPGMWPTEIAEIYGIPCELDAKGVCVGVVAAGGGYQPADIDLASTSMHRPAAQVIPYPVKGVHQTYPGNSFTGGSTADIELALDIQILAGIVPGAQIVVYFAANTEQGFADAINQALSDGINRPSVLSISWGGAEGTSFSLDGCKIIDRSLARAGKFGLTVLAASGDDLATADIIDTRAHVLFPASSSYVIACGGTQLDFGSDGTSLKDETVWNEGLKGSDGGISDVFDVPHYQENIALPSSCNAGRKGRGMPDVAAAAAQHPGYRIILNGKDFVTCGTSAATPLWAALIGMANAKRGRPLGAFHDFLYSNPLLCRQITKGNNRCNGIGYDAGPGWNACTGWGVPNGVDTINGLAAMP